MPCTHFFFDSAALLGDGVAVALGTAAVALGTAAVALGTAAVALGTAVAMLCCEEAMNYLLWNRRVYFTLLFAHITVMSFSLFPFTQCVLTNSPTHTHTLDICILWADGPKS